MCRNIKTLFNFDPPATDQEIHDAALQFVRKLSGFQKPSKENEEAFTIAVATIANDAHSLIHSLTTNAHPHNREEEAKRTHERALKRFGTS